MRICDLTFDARLRDAVAANLSSLAIVPASADRRAAVAVTLIEADGDAAVVLTQRALHLTAHPGQFALPGGRVDPGETVEEAALRELGEEVGVYVDEGSILGRLDDFVTRSGYSIAPVVVWAGEVEFEPNPAEVRAVYRVPLRELDRDDAPYVTPIPESDRPVLSMPLFTNEIFAPTAAFLYQFREVALRGLHTRVAHFEQPTFAWK